MCNGRLTTQSNVCSVCRPVKCANAPSVIVDWLQSDMISVCSPDKCANAPSMMVLHHGRLLATSHLEIPQRCQPPESLVRDRGLVAPGHAKTGRSDDAGIQMQRLLVRRCGYPNAAAVSPSDVHDDMSSSRRCGSCRAGCMSAGSAILQYQCTTGPDYEGLWLE